MTAEQLRNSILQEAISGRLVPQDPNDEPASVLLERLREERLYRIKRGEIKLSKPEKALKIEITNDFELPNSWTWCVLNDLCRAFGRIGYRGYTKNDIVSTKEKGAIAISPSNMENNRLKLDVCTYITEAKYLESPEIMVENGDILLTKTASVGKLALVENLPWKATINPQIAVLKEISIDRKYLTYALASPYIQDIIHGFTIGTSIPTYSQEKMIGINIPLPPLAEQKRIVAKLEELLPIVDQYGKAQTELDELNAALPSRLRQSILAEAIIGKLIAQNENDEPAILMLQRAKENNKKLLKEGLIKKKYANIEVLNPNIDDFHPDNWKENGNVLQLADFSLPNNWAWCRLSSLCWDFIVPQRDKPTRFDGDIPWCRIEDMQGKYFNGSLSGQNVTMELIKEMNMHICPAGSVICACSASIGNQAITLCDCCTNQTFIGLHCNKSVIYNEYLYYFFAAIAKTLKELGRGTTIKYISREKFENMLIPLPPLAEQQRIVAKIEELFEQIDKISK